MKYRILTTLLFLSSLPIIPLSSEQPTTTQAQMAPVLRGLTILGSEAAKNQSEFPEARGVHVFDPMEARDITKLRALLTPRFINQPLSRQRLREIKNKVLQFYQQRGQKVRVIYPPGQSLSNGVLKMVVVHDDPSPAPIYYDDDIPPPPKLITRTRPPLKTQVAVATEALPRTPEPPQIDTMQGNEVLIPCLNSIVLVGNPNEVHKEGFGHLDDLFIIDVTIPGNIQHLRKELRDHFIGHPLTERRLKELKEYLLDYFRCHCMPVVAVQVPEQDITHGTLQLLVYQGKLGHVYTKGNCYTPSCLLKSYLRLEEGDDIDENIIIADLAMMNRNPFRTTDIIYSPGREPGTTDIELITADRRPFRFYAGAENTGVKSTDELCLLAGFNWGNVFGWDHVFTYQFTSSSDFHKFRAHTIQYSAPLPTRDILLLFGGVSFVHPDKDIVLKALCKDDPDKFKDATCHGFGLQGSLRYQIPLCPTSGYLHELTLGFDFKRTNNTVEVSEKPFFGSYVNLTQLVLGYTAAWERVNTKTTLGAELFFSPGKWLPDQDNNNFDSLRTHARNTYLYGILSFSHHVKLCNDWSISLRAKGQATTRNLLPSEECSLGGHASVRGYDEHEENADNAVLFSTELRTPVWSVFKRNSCSPRDELQLLAFFDLGFGGPHKPSECDHCYNLLMGVGPGLRYMLTPHLSARLDLGFKLDHKKALGKNNHRIYFSVIGSF